MSVLEMAKSKSKLSMIDAGKGADVSAETVRNWIGRGCKVGKKVVRLRGFRIGDRWFTTQENLETFLRELNG